MVGVGGGGGGDTHAGAYVPFPCAWARPDPQVRHGISIHTLGFHALSSRLLHVTRKGEKGL